MGRLTHNVGLTIFHPPNQLMFAPTKNSLQHFQLAGLQEIALKSFNQVTLVQFEQHWGLGDGTKLFAE
jgi:hypothetical protein